MIVPLPCLGKSEDVLGVSRIVGTWELNSLCCLEALKIYVEMKECSSDLRCLPNFQFFVPQSCGTYLLIN